MERYREESFLEVAVEVTILLISCCGTILGNVMVLAAVVIKEKLHTPTYFYYLSLAASDLILGKCFRLCKTLAVTPVCLRYDSLVLHLPSPTAHNIATSKVAVIFFLAV